jgi:glyoxylase-like metal-dependent hydrolase (beta-lactamase superfamily II)
VAAPSLGTRPYERGLLELGNGAWAWLQPDGGWGWSNAGLVVDGEASLLIDTLFDVPLTDAMLRAMRDAEPRAAARIDVVVNTHANGDHCNGNELVADAEIIASAATLEEMQHDIKPGQMAELVKKGPELGPMGAYFAEIFGPFDFAGVTQTLPNRTFAGRLEVPVGDKIVQLEEVGPAHTRGDVLALVPADRTVFTGDILFVEGTPIVWAGPIANCIAACDRILEMDVETVVPGHGPVTDQRGVRAVKRYFEFVRDESRRRFEAGMPVFEAAADIALGEFAHWGDRERIAVNVVAMYRELSGEPEGGPSIFEVFGAMAELRNQAR